MADAKDPRDSKQAWSLVGERFSELGGRIARHYQQSGETGEQAAAETERALERAAKEVVEVLRRSVDTVGETFRDREAGAEFTEALNALGDAISATAHETGATIRGARDRPAEPPTPPTDDPTP